ncbi:MAG: hypothetical protein OSB09_04855 [Planctomycetota bacterium]|nr:hypothetical protein [Planctomycetota bacterium]
MGIIESWMKRSRHDEETQKDLFAAGAQLQLLQAATRVSERGHRLAAARLLRAGTIRFHPWPEGETALDQLERTQARETLHSLQVAVESRYTAVDAARLSAALERLGDTSGALGWAHAAIEEDPCNPEGYLAIARGYLRRFRRDEDAVAGLQALRYLTKACQLHAGHGECLRSLAMLLLLLRAPSAAAKVMRPIIRATPSDPLVLALESLAAVIPPENTSNVQELFLRWETGAAPIHNNDATGVIPAPDGFSVWELDGSRALTACSATADQGHELKESLSVLAGSLVQATARIGLGQIGRVTVRSSDGVLIGLAEGDGIIFSHSDRPSTEASLSRWLESDRGREQRR